MICNSFRKETQISIHPGALRRIKSDQKKFSWQNWKFWLSFKCAKSCETWIKNQQWIKCFLEVSPKVWETAWKKYIHIFSILLLAHSQTGLLCIIFLLGRQGMVSVVTASYLLTSEVLELGSPNKRKEIYLSESELAHMFCSWFHLPKHFLP